MTYFAIRETQWNIVYGKYDDELIQNMIAGETGWLLKRTDFIPQLTKVANDLVLNFLIEAKNRIKINPVS
jgi:hypothetical protein